MNPRDPRSSAAAWLLGSKRIELDRPRLIAILNLTPDSFFDGGVLTDVHAAVATAVKAVADGADMLDLGGESTRPGAQRISADEQIRRTVPVIDAIRRVGGPLATIPISIDTTLAPVARAALDAGADAINDVSAGTEDDGMFALAAQRRAGLILMHRLRPPAEDSYSNQYAEGPNYADVVVTVCEFLRSRAMAAIRAGVATERIVLDPGLGFGKTVEQNLELIRRTGEIADLRFPILSALSRKSFTGIYGGLRDSTPQDRLAPTLELSIAHLHAGAILFRVHDVAEHVKVLAALPPVAAGWNKPKRSLHTGRMYHPTASERARAHEMRPEECPRRYCWWWESMEFEWDKAPRDGCRLSLFLKTPGVFRGTPQIVDTPCCRAEPTSNVDHMELRNSTLWDDGFDTMAWPPKKLPPDQCP